jgi:NADH-quinone oxidoreductase subunit N
MFLQQFSLEIFLSLTILFHLLYNTFIFKELENIQVIYLEQHKQLFIVLLFSIIILLSYDTSSISFSNFFFINNSGTVQLKLIFFIVNLFAFYLIYFSYLIEQLQRFEFFTLYLLFLLGSSLLISSDHFFSVYLSIEMISLIFYIFSTYKHNSIFSVDAGIRYFLFGAVFSIVFLFGISLLYGIFGTLSFYELKFLNFYELSPEYQKISMIAFAFIFFALFSKLLVAPFHFWATEIYEGVPLNTLIIFLIISKIGLIVILIKIINLMGELFYSFQIYFYILSFLSLFIGTFNAIQQNRFKRLMFFSSVSQLGFILLGIANKISYENIILFLIIYCLTNLIIWYVIINIHNNQLIKTKFTKKLNTTFFSLVFLRNNMNTFNFLITVLILVLFIIGGLPPFPSFMTKIYILINTMETENYFFAILFLLLSIISMFYSLRLLKILIVEPNLIQIKNKLENITISFDFPKIHNFYNYFLIILLFLICFFTINITDLLIYCQYIIQHDILLIA